MFVKRSMMKRSNRELRPVGLPNLYILEIMMCVFCCLPVVTRVCLAQEYQPIQLYGVNYVSRKGKDWDPENIRCKTEDEITNDLQQLRQITSRIRILSLVDCNQGSSILKVAITLNFQIFIGLWVGPNSNVVQSEINELKRLIQDEPQYFDPTNDYVIGISVGSEALWRKEVTLENLIGHKDTVKATLNDTNLEHIPVTIVDISDTYISNSPTLYEEVDVIMINNFAFWERTLIQDPVMAPNFMANTRLAPIINWASRNNKEWIIGETGWSGEGFDEDSNSATAENQALYFRAFFCKAKELGWAYYWFTGIDNDWRIDQALAEGDETTVEGRFGIFRSDLTLKDHYRNLDFSCPFPADATRYYFDVNGTLPTADDPTAAVTGTPTSYPTVSTGQPTRFASAAPSKSPTDAPTTLKPTASPTRAPTNAPTIAPIPVSDPTDTPVTGSPTDNVVTLKPTSQQTPSPTESSQRDSTLANATSGSLSIHPWRNVVIIGKWSGVIGFAAIFLLL